MEMLVYEDMTSCTHLAHHHVISQIATFYHCSVIALATNYTDVPSISIHYFHGPYWLLVYKFTHLLTQAQALFHHHKLSDIILTSGIY